MAEFSYKNDDQADERLNPAEIQNRESNSGGDPQADSEKNALNQNYNSSNDSDTAKESLNKTTGDNGYYNQAARSSGRSSVGGIKGVGKFLKRRSVATGLIAAIVGGFGGFLVLFSPSLAVVHMKEVLTDDLNDQVAAMDVRGSAVLRSKLKGLGKPLSSCKLIKVRCGLRGMTDRHIRSFRAAGIEVETLGEKQFGKTAVKSLTFTDSGGKKIKVSSVGDFDKFAIDSNIRSQLRRAYNPRFMSISDSVMGKIRMLGAFKFSKHDRLGADPDNFDENMKRALNGDAPVDVSDQKATSGDESTDAEKSRVNDANSEVDKTTRLVNESTGVRGAFTSLGKGLGVLGTIDSACTVRNLGLAVEAGAKVIRAYQLAEFASTYMTFADSVKAGTATPEQSDYINTKLTAIDNRAKVINETSPVVDGKAQPVDNPNYGKNAYDSEGMRVAMYNDAPSLSAEAQQFMVGGAMVGTLAAVNDKITSLLGGREAARTKCKVVQNAGVRIGSTIAGIAIGIGSGGASLALQVAGSVAFAAAAPLLASYLKDMVAGNTVSEDTSGPDAGNAIFSGTASILGAASAARGLKPLNKSEMKTYQAAINEVKSEYIAQETEAAKSTPFDVMNQYSFLGSLARTFNPTATHIRSNAAIAITQLPSLFSAALRGTASTTQAVGEYNPDRFTKCNDEAYDYLKIDADVFCNVRYGLSAAEMAMDPEVVMQALYDRGDITEDGSVVDGSEYSNWLQECTQRTSGWGEPEEGEENKGLGEQCVGQLPKYKVIKYSWFRVYSVDESIQQGMDNGPTEEQNQNSSDAGVNFTVASYNILRVTDTKHTAEVCRALGLPNNETCTKKRIALQADIINGKTELNNKPFDLVMTQEMTPKNYSEMKKVLPEFDSKVSDEFGVFWRRDAFPTKFDDGTVKANSGSGRTLDAPWVGLKTSEGRNVYATSFHYSSFAQFNGSPAQTTIGAQRTLNWIKSKADDDSIVVAGGDAGYFSSFAAKVFNGSGVVKNAGLMAAGKPSSGRDKAVGADQIYITPIKNLKIIDYNRPAETPGSVVVKASDHAPVYGTVVLPSAATTQTAGGTWVGDASSQGFQWPSKTGRVSNCWRLPTGGSSGHAGIDISTSTGTAVYAAKAGTVVMAGPAGDAGNAVMIKHANGLWSNYQHNSQVLVSVGDKVSQGQQIAKSGSTGYSTGPHIHFGITDAQTLSSRRTLANSLKPTLFLPTKPGGIGGISCP